MTKAEFDKRIRAKVREEINEMYEMHKYRLLAKAIDATGQCSEHIERELYAHLDRMSEIQRQLEAMKEEHPEFN